MHVFDFKNITTVKENIIIGFIVACHRCDSRTGKSCQRREEKTIECQANQIWNQCNECKCYYAIGIFRHIRKEGIHGCRADAILREKEPSYTLIWQRILAGYPLLNHPHSSDSTWTLWCWDRQMAWLTSCALRVAHAYAQRSVISALYQTSARTSVSRGIIGQCFLLSWLQCEFQIDMLRPVPSSPTMPGFGRFGFVRQPWGLRRNWWCIIAWQHLRPF